MWRRREFSFGSIGAGRGALCHAASCRPSEWPKLAAAVGLSFCVLLFHHSLVRTSFDSIFPSRRRYDYHRVAPAEILPGGSKCDAGSGSADASAADQSHLARSGSGVFSRHAGGCRDGVDHGEFAFCRCDVQEMCGMRMASRRDGAEVLHRLPCRRERQPAWQSARRRDGSWFSRVCDLHEPGGGEAESLHEWDKLLHSSLVSKSYLKL